MRTQRFQDTCDWCGCGTNSIQSRGRTYLCPSCCPDVDPDEIPENAPSSWNHMSEEEKEDWRKGMTMEEIMEKHNWHVLPERSNV